jgi:hypothetical protein
MILFWITFDLFLKLSNILWGAAELAKFGLILKRRCQVVVDQIHDIRGETSK